VWEVSKEVLLIGKGGKLESAGVKLDKILNLGVEAVVVSPNSLDKGVVVGEWEWGEVEVANGEWASCFPGRGNNMEVGLWGTGEVEGVDEWRVVCLPSGVVSRVNACVSKTNKFQEGFFME
jgi:hypothetical protein